MCQKKSEEFRKKAKPKDVGQSVEMRRLNKRLYIMNECIEAIKESYEVHYNPDDNYFADMDQKIEKVEKFVSDIEDLMYNKDPLAKRNLPFEDSISAAHTQMALYEGVVQSLMKQLSAYQGLRRVREDYINAKSGGHVDMNAVGIKDDLVRRCLTPKKPRVEGPRRK